MNEISVLTRIQEWFRYYSDNLENSFRSSELINHNVSKGEDREKQILDTLLKLLPTKISVESKTVIVDSLDSQAPSFDGILVNRVSWPRLFAGEGTPIALIESVLSVIEVKSFISEKEIKDIFEKSKKFLSMHSHSSPLPMVTSFAYKCNNISLSFFDFVTHFKSNPEYSPSLICILNEGLYGFAETVAGKTIPMDKPNLNTLPILYYTRKDSLLMYFYLLSFWAGMDDDIADIYRKYCADLFANMECFYFDNDFLNMIVLDENAKNIARKCFERKASVDIGELYFEARKALNLP